VEAIRQRMIRAELWSGMEIFYDHWFGEGKVINKTALWLDVLIGLGWVVRAWDEEIGDYRYCDAGRASSEDQTIN
jgi:hypothetical protein